MAIIAFMPDLYSQEITLDKIDDELYNSYKKIKAYRFDSDTIAWDALEIENKLFKDKIENYTSKYSSTLTYNFPLLKENNIHIVSSEDKLFRIYSWNTWQGGTMDDFQVIYQYKSDGKIYSKNPNNFGIPENDYYIPFFSIIYTLKTNTKTYYLAVYNGSYSSKDVSQSIKVFSIENNQLNEEVKIIKTQSGLTNAIDVYFDFFSVVDRPERPLELIKYDSDKKIIYIPIVLENGKVTKRFITYKFNGEYFERINKKSKEN